MRALAGQSGCGVPTTGENMARSAAAFFRGPNTPAGPRGRPSSRRIARTGAVQCRMAHWLTATSEAYAGFEIAAIRVSQGA